VHVIEAPQPVSGVASPSSAARTVLATREVRRFTRPSARRTRWPATSSRDSPAAKAAAARASSAGMSAGSFWPSPSSVTIQPPRAAATPVAMAALCPQPARWRRTRTPNCAAASASRAAVASALPSST
jgi:hypothetical protein